MIKQQHEEQSKIDVKKVELDYYNIFLNIKILLRSRKDWRENNEDLKKDGTNEYKD